MTLSIAYQPGRACYVAAAPGAVLVLGADVRIDTVRAAWDALDGGGIATVLDALTGAFGTSLTAIPPFALAVSESGGVRFAVRGSTAWDVQTGTGPRRISGTAASTWVEVLVSDVEGFSFVDASHGSDAVTSGEDGLGGGNLPIRDGVVGAASFVVTVGEFAHGADSAPPSQAPAPIDSLAEVHSSDGPEDVEPSERGEVPTPGEIPEPGETPEVEPVPGAGNADDADAGAAPSLTQTWMPSVTHTSSPGLSSDAVSLDDTANASTIVRPRDAPPIPARTDLGPEPAERSRGDHDGHTVTRDPSRRRPSDRTGSPAAPRAAAPRAHRRMRISDGTVVDLTGTVIIGRRPRAVRNTGSELPTLVAVDSPQQDISRSHLEIRIEGEHVLATDLQTTNGTVLLRGGHEPVRLHPTEATMVIVGDVLDLGDGVTVVLEDAR